MRAGAPDTAYAHLPSRRHNFSIYYYSIYLSYLGYAPPGSDAAAPGLRLTDASEVAAALAGLSVKGLVAGGLAALTQVRAGRWRRWWWWWCCCRIS